VDSWGNIGTESERATRRESVNIHVVGKSVEKLEVFNHLFSGHGIKRNRGLWIRQNRLQPTITNYIT